MNEFDRLPFQLRDALLTVWNLRPCFVCDKPGICEHRDLDHGLAELEGHTRKVAEIRRGLDDERTEQTRPAAAPRLVKKKGAA